MGLLGGILDLVTGALNWLFGVVSTLTQVKTNGASSWGTLLAPLLPLFLTNNPLPLGFPWGSLSCEGTNAYTDSPNTGVIRSYDWTISRGVLAPDGYQRDVLLVNGAFPGPLIEANWGDTIQVTVHNNITGPEEGTSLHWHGFLQTGTPWEDGVPGVSQCPIAPGKSFTYQFRASLFGTSWYHSHYSAQYAGGVVGPIVIYGPTQKSYDIDVGPIMLSDWYHKSYFDIIQNETLAVGGGPKVFSDNNLINGKMNFNCSSVDAGDTTPCTGGAGVSKFRFQEGKTHRLRLINSGADGVQRFSLDGHMMTVIAEDFVPVRPYDTKVVTLGVGQRTDVLVKADAGDARSAYWMRANLTSCTLAKQPLAVAAVYYDGADTSSAPASAAWDVPDPGTCVNDLGATEPLFPIALPEATYTHTYDIDLFVNDSDVTLWKFDGVSFRADYNAPPLLLASLGNTSYPDIWNVRNTYSNSSVRMVVSNHSPSPHPMHLHGANMYVLHEGPGDWDGTILNATNPVRRDVALIRGNGHLVLQFDATNPGVWPFHCHIAWHASGGFFLQFLVQPDKVREYQIPSTVAQTCREWGAWTETAIPNQIDSGL